MVGLSHDVKQQRRFTVACLPTTTTNNCHQLRATFDFARFDLLGTANIHLPKPSMPSGTEKNEDVAGPSPLQNVTPHESINHQPTPEHYKPRQLAKRWSVSIDKVLNFIRAGELRAFDIAASTSSRPRYLISTDEVRRFEEQVRAVPKKPKPVGKGSRRKRPSNAKKPVHRYF